MNKLIPNSFQIPNSIVDDFIKLLNCNDLKIYLIIVRKTKGWNKEFDGISISQFIQFSGISSHNTIRKSLKNLEKLNLIKEVKRAGKFSLFCLADPYQNLTMSNNDTVDGAPLPKIDTHPYQKLTIQKDTNKEEEERRKNFFEDFYNWLPKMNIKNDKWFKKSIKQNLLNGDHKTVENFEEFMNEKIANHSESQKNNIVHQQFNLLLVYLSDKTPNQILKSQNTQEYYKVFESRTCDYIDTKGGLVELSSSFENQSYHTYLKMELQKFF